MKNPKGFLFFLVLFISFQNSFSQGDDCANATVLTNVSNYCSGNGFYTSTGSTASGFGNATCWPANATNDIWFSFTATGSDLTVTVSGLGSGGGTMNSPSVALYSGSCAGVINELACANGPAATDLASLYKGGLAIGTTYYIRISTSGTNAGTFELCVNSYSPPLSASADCGGASLLCDKSPVSNVSLSGGGANPNEPVGTCLDLGFPPIESNSAWYTWTCGTAGTLTFDLTPFNPTDDIDWVLYQLNSTNPCGSKIEIRCNAASCLNATGSTGLNTFSTDVSETAGCAFPQDAYCSQVNMTSGTSYALVVNNWSTSSGFSLSFGGTGTFQGPNANIVANTSTICPGQSVTFNGSTSTNYSTLNWNFGTGASPSTATGPGPHTVTYSSSGVVTAVLSANTALACPPDVESISFSVSPINTVSAASSSPNLCANSLLSPNITFTTTGASGIGAPIGLPPGLNATWSSNVITISGTPTSTGTFNYSIPLTGGCGTVSATGTISVSVANSVGTASSSPSLCVNGSLSPSITFTTTGATGIGSPSGLPPGVSASWNSNVITISGSPTSTGTFNYSIPLTGGCGTVSAIGTINVTNGNTVDSPSYSPTLCVNSLLSPDITFNTSGATGIGTPNGLPPGITASWSSNTITISGTPTSSGTFSYTIPLTGGCGAVDATGVILVNPSNSVSSPSYSPTLCVNSTLSPSVTFTTTGATGIGVPIGLAPGIAASWSSNTITISGTPTISGSYNYNIPLSGGCGNVNASGTITVDDIDLINAASSNPTVCVNSAISPSVTFTTNGVSGINTPSGLPSGVNATFSNNSITVSGTPTSSGIYTFTLTSTGTCSTSATGTITVDPTPTITVNSETICSGATATLTANSNGNSFIWSPSTGLNVTNGNQVIVNTNSDISYTVVSSIGNCNANATASVTVIQNPTVTVNSPTVCSGNTVTLNANSNASSFSWSPSAGLSGTTGSTVTLTASGTVNLTYTVTAYIGTCTSSATSNVSISPSPTASLTASQFNGCAPLCATFNASSASPLQSVAWSFTNGTSSNINPTTLICFNNPGTYGATAVITNSLGCQSTISNNSILTVYPVPNADFIVSPETTTVSNPVVSFTDQSTGAVISQWNWSSGNAENSNVQNPTFNYPEPGTYTISLQVVSQNNCVDSVEHTVFVIEDFSLYIPNSFTPNLDGINEVFKPKGLGFDLDSYTMSIFDRWGTLIFETQDWDKGWNGMYKNNSEPIKEDVYVYKISLRNLIGENKTLIGKVTVLR